MPKEKWLRFDINNLPKELTDKFGWKSIKIGDNEVISYCRKSSITAKQKSDFKNLFYRRYKSKTKEITGTEAALPWSGKEGKLLTADIETHGYETLVKYAEIFFSDREKEIAEFTRYKNMAGYTYGVFHGMFSKLALSKVKPLKSCPQCGKTFGHDDNCPVMVEIRRKKKEDDDEINRLRDLNSNFSLVAEFGKRINKGA